MDETKLPPAWAVIIIGKTELSLHYRRPTKRRAHVKIRTVGLLIAKHIKSRGNKTSCRIRRHDEREKHLNEQIKSITMTNHVQASGEKDRTSRRNA